MKYIIAVLLSAALISFVPKSTTPAHINKSESVASSTQPTESVQQPVTAKAQETEQSTTPVEPEPQVVEEAKPQEQIAPQITDHEQLMSQAGIDQNEWAAADYIVSHESGWCFTKWEGQIGYCPESYTQVFDPENPYKGYGLCQSTPAIKMASTATDWQTSPITQLKWCTAYAVARYGSWTGAYSHWLEAHRW